MENHTTHPLGDWRPTSTKMRPRLVGHLAPHRGHNPRNTTTLTRKYSIGRSPTPLPSQSSTPIPTQSSTPFPSQSSGRGDAAQVPPSERPQKVSSFISHGYTGKSIAGSSVSLDNLATYVQIMEDSRAKLKGRTTFHCLTSTPNTFTVRYITHSWKQSI